MNASTCDSSTTRWVASSTRIVIAVVMSAAVSVARADIQLGQFLGQHGFGFTDGTPLGSTYLVFQVDPAPMGQVAAQPSLFENILWTPAIVGQEFLATAATDANFAAITAKLTDGQDHRVLMWHFEGPAITGRGTAFPRLESQNLGAAGHPDLFGRSITSLSLIVTSYRTAVVRDGGTFDFVDWQVTAYGVPEPSSSMSAICTAAAFAARRRRRTRPALNFAPAIGCQCSLCVTP